MLEIARNCARTRSKSLEKCLENQLLSEFLRYFAPLEWDTLQALFTRLTELKGRQFFHILVHTATTLRPGDNVPLHGP